MKVNPQKTNCVLFDENGPAAAESGLRMARLTYLIAHELRNPCTIIGGFAALLNRVVKPADKEGEYARIILQESARMERAIDAVLAFSQTLGSDKQLLGLDQLASQTVDVLRKRHPDANIRVCESRDTQSLLVSVVPDQVSAALAEVIGQLLTGGQQDLECELRIERGSDKGRLYIMPLQSNPDASELRSLVAAVAAPGRDPATLPLTLARESLRLNRCELELAAESSGRTYLYVEMPLSEVKHVQSAHVR